MGVTLHRIMVVETVELTLKMLVALIYNTCKHTDPEYADQESQGKVKSPYMYSILLKSDIWD